MISTHVSLFYKIVFRSILSHQSEVFRRGAMSKQAAAVDKARKDIIDAVSLRQSYINEEHKNMSKLADFGLPGINQDGGVTPASGLELEWVSGIMQVRVPGAEPAPAGYSGHGVFSVRDLNSFYQDTKQMNITR